jgi:hypothetical protein
LFSEGAKSIVSSCNTRSKSSIKKLEVSPLEVTKENEILYAVVQQSYVAITQNTDLSQVKAFLGSNEFINN